MADINLVSASAAEIIRVGGITMRVLEDGSRTDNRIGAFEITVPPRTPGPPRHAHHMHDETFLIISGAVQFTVGDEALDAHWGIMWSSRPTPRTPSPIHSTNRRYSSTASRPHTTSITSASSKSW